MNIDPEIRDQAYQFFIEEAAELLEAIETGLLTLREDTSAAQLHTVMRAAHSIKGGAASVDLNGIKTLAHRLETIFKALYSDQVIFDTALESKLLKAFDCLKYPLEEQVETGFYDEEAALATAEPIFQDIETSLGTALEQADNFLPSSSDLGIDMVASIFEIDVLQGLDRLKQVLHQPQNHEVSGELRAQLEVFSGFADLLNLPGFGAICQTTTDAIASAPDQILTILQQAIIDFEAARELVLAGDRAQGGVVSETLLSLAQPSSFNKPDLIEWPLGEAMDESNLIEDFTPSENDLTDIFGQRDTMPSEIDLSDAWVGPSTLETDAIEVVLEVEDTTDIEIGFDDNLIDGGLIDDGPIDNGPIDNGLEENASDIEIGFDGGLIDDGSIDNGLATTFPQTEQDLEAIFGQEEPEAYEDNEDEALIDSALIPEDLTEPLAQPEQDIAAIFGQEEPNISDVEDAVSASQAAPDSLQGTFAAEDDAASRAESADLLWIYDSEIDNSEIDAPKTESADLLWIDNTETDDAGIEDTELSSELLDNDSLIAETVINLDAIPVAQPTDEIIVDEASITELNQSTDSSIANEANITEIESVAINETEIGQETDHNEHLSNATEDILAEAQIEEETLEDQSPEGYLPVEEIADNIESAIQSIDDLYDNLPVATELPETKPLKEQESSTETLSNQPAPVGVAKRLARKKAQTHRTLTAKIALDRLERMDNFVGELAINRNGLSLQNEQFQRTVRNLKRRFGKFRELAKQLQMLSDKMVVNPDRVNLTQEQQPISAVTPSLLSETQFDALEMDSYNAVNILLEELLEELFQVEESIEDVSLFAGQSNQKLQKQRQLLTQLRDELMWSRMVPLSGVLNRFPRVLRDLSSAHQKPVQLKLTGTEVLVDRVMLEKLYDPLLHLLRNGFDHGIESPDERLQQGKTEQGTIEIRAYHQGNNTVLEIRDDGRGLNLERIGQRAVEAGFLSVAELQNARPQQLYNYIFEPGFSTAAQVSELSGRGVGLDVVRERLQTFNGKITLQSKPGEGTTFILKIPLTLTLLKLIVVGIGATLVALPSDGIEEILTPLENQVKETTGQRFLHWRQQLIPIHSLETALPYFCPVPETTTTSMGIPAAFASRYRTKKPLLILQSDQAPIALEIDQILTEQELVIKPFSKAIAAPEFINGCTVLGDGRLVPVIDGTGVIEYSPSKKTINRSAQPPTAQIPQATTNMIMVVDDSSALRRTLALTLQKAGYQVIQAKDGREALDQLKQNTLPHLIICDIEMPQMNGFELLSQRRLTPEYAIIPTLMLTSRSSQKHRNLALQLGATDYFTKPYIEAEFLSAIKTHLTSSSSPSTSLTSSAL